MTVIDSLDKLLYTAAGVLVFWFSGVIRDWLKTKTAQRRKETDKQARAELKARLLTESLYEHRTLMLRSGHWTRESLPAFIKEH